MKEFTSWEEVFEAFSEVEKSEIRAQVADTCGQETVSDEKVCADVESYFDEYVGDSTANCYGNEVPDVVDEHWVYSKKIFSGH